jgi:SpoIID/LytB domain protein
VFEPLDTAGLVTIVGTGSFHGRLVVTGAGAGLSLVNDLPVEDYLRGIAEMPSSWPVEALKAQVIAARSYVLAQKAAGSFSSDDADICATDACQVYEGADREPNTPLWQEAVQATKGLVLLYQGSPIVARYHSTDGGRTKSNREVFGTDVPYLQAVDDPDDAVSPVHHWVVRFPLADLEATLRSRSETAPAAGRVTDASRAPGGPLLVTTEEPGQGRQTSSLDADQVMVRLNNDAPDRFPGRYPGPTESGGGRLPLTIPDDDYTVQAANGVATFVGRGWGHKVGMSQYGAKGKAERGLSASEILASYYSGLVPTSYAGPPSVRVLLDTGVDSRVITSNGPFRITDGSGHVIVDSTLGGWTATTDGAQVRLAPPDGINVPVAVGSAVPVLTPLAQGTAGAIRFSLSAPARIESTLEGPHGTRRLPGRVLDAGEQELRLGDLLNKVLPAPGGYRLRVVATDIRGQRAETVAAFEIAANARADIPPSRTLFGMPTAGLARGALPPSTPHKAGSGFPLASVIAVGILGAVVIALWRIRRWLDRMDPVAGDEARRGPSPG